MIILGILCLVNLSLEFILYLWKGLLWEISFFFFLTLQLHYTACGILVLLPESEPGTPTVKAQSLNH